LYLVKEIEKRTMNKNLEDKSEELEQTLLKQLQLFKEDSKDWVKVGGLVLAGGLVTFAIVQATRKKKNRETERALEVLEREGLLSKDLEKKLNSSSKSSFWPSLGERLLLVGLAFAKEKYFPNLLNLVSEDDISPEEGK
jgi:hypothetical protein